MIHEVFHHGRRLGSLSGRKDEAVGRVVAGLGHHLERALEVVPGLTRESHDEVRGHGQVVDPHPGCGEAFEVPLGRVAAVHGRQDPVTARLEWEVEVLADLRGVGHGGDRLGTEVLGVWAGEADPADPLNRTAGRQQVGEEWSGPTGRVGRPDRARLVGIGRSRVHTAESQCQVASVGVHVLAKQGDLADPVGSQSLNLGHHLAEGTADLWSPHRRHDAERATVITADLNGHPGLVVSVPLGR